MMEREAIRNEYPLEHTAFWDGQQWLLKEGEEIIGTTKSDQLAGAYPDLMKISESEARIKELESDLDDAEGELDTLRDEMEQLECTCSGKDYEIEGLRDDIEELKSEIDELNDTIAVQVDIIEDWETKYSELENERSSE